MKRISYVKYVNWKMQYFASHKEERFGQAFMNAFYPTIPRDDHELWEEKNAGKAEAMIFKKYIA